MKIREVLLFTVCAAALAAFCVSLTARAAPTYGVPFSVQGPDGGPVTVFSVNGSGGGTQADGGSLQEVDLQGVLADETLSCASPCQPVVCNADGGAGSFTLFANYNQPNGTSLGRHSLVVDNKCLSTLEVSKDAGVGLLTPHPFQLYPGQSFSFSGTNTYTGPVYICLDADAGNVSCVFGGGQ